MKPSLILLAALAAGPAAAAPVQWSVNGHFYEVVTTNAQSTFAGALAAAAASTHAGLTGYLATITSADEQAFLNTLNSSTAWLGGSDAGSEGTWTWVTGPEAGEAFAYTNWAGGEPNDYGSTGEDALLGWWHGDQWNDIYDGYSSYAYVVEYSPAAVPVPAAGILLVGALGALGALRRRKAA